MIERGFFDVTILVMAAIADDFFGSGAALAPAFDWLDAAALAADFGWLDTEAVANMSECLLSERLL